MNRRSFPGCCAGLVFYDLGGTYKTAGYKGNYTSKDIKEFLRKEELIYDMGFYIIAINNQQNEFMASILKNLKYKCVGKDIKSPGHPSSTIFLYLKTKQK